MDTLFSSATKLEELNHECSTHLELRERRKGSGTAYVKQCVFCGEQRGSDIAKSTIDYIPPSFDDVLNSKYLQKRKDFFHKDYPNTIKSNTSIETSFSVFENELNEFLDDFHHKHDECNIQEFISRFLMRQRDAFIKSYQNSWKNEQQISKWFIQEFSQWFDIYPEVEGYGFINHTKKPLRIDFVIRAKQDLIDRGFTSQPFGVEVKFFDPRPDHGFHGKSSRGIFQALSYWYSGARWHLSSSEPNATLASILLLSNFSFPLDRDYIFNSYDKHFSKYWRAYLSISNHANIGELIMMGDLETKYGWKMHYNGSNYYSIYPNGKHSKANDNLINKQRIGNTK